MKKTFEQKVLDFAVEEWHRRLAGTTSLDIARKLRASNKKVMTAMVNLESEGKCTLNKDAEFFVMSLSETGKMRFAKKAKLAHVIFPSAEILTDYFYSSGLARQGMPVYKERLHKGAHKYDMACFTEDVLARYLDRPELYDVEDSLSGGSIRSNTEDESHYIYVRHGRRQLANGRSAVLVPYKDLSNLDEAQQRYWSGHEILNPEAIPADENYSLFIARTFDGAFVEYDDPIRNLLQTLRIVNEKIGNSLALFRHTENAHLRIPVENTEKAFYDACSEVFKLIGPDSLVAPTIKKLLVEEFATAESEFIHKNSGRALSTFQQLQLLEQKAKMEAKATSIIDQVKAYRTRADHAIVKPQSSPINYVEKFNVMCNDVAYALYYFAIKLEAVRDESLPSKT